MNETDTDKAFDLLPDWFPASARDLPWRADREPYHIWLSEIMLQQTRVEAVKAYYTRFLNELPTIHALACCEEAKLLKLWEGLGYYSRAGNLKKAACIIDTEYGGVFPDAYETILSLPGIGPYTAGAIGSIAFGIPTAAVDGNVLRVLSRLTDDERDITSASVKKEAETVVTSYLSSHPSVDPGLVNQALMELGAIVCLPNGVPHCTRCPWYALCAARQNGTIGQRPVKAARKSRRVEKRTILLIMDGERLFLHRRPKKGLLAGMNEPVNRPGHLKGKEVTSEVRRMGFSPVRVIRAPDAKHIFTHIEWEMQGYLVQIEEPENFEETAERFFADREMIRTQCAVPAAFKVYMEWIGMQERQQ